ncbi:MAG: hypothetical protein GX786_09785 [Clostridiales bacterium]|nr:hypothetical protein [Clostridiales bacterium]
MERYYTIEDIEILRNKSGISYEEAVNLLEYHNGNLAKALVDLEKNGKINTHSNKQAERNDQPYAQHNEVKGKKSASNFFTNLYRFRIIVRKNNMTIANLSLLYLIVTSIFAFYVVIASLILLLLLGYQISVDKNSPDFAKDNFESMIKAGAKNVKNTVDKFTINEEENSSFSSQEQENSYYHRKSTQAPPSNSSPVTAEYEEDGEVVMTEHDDGSQEVTIQ